MTHPRDEWVDVTPYGATEPQYVLARDGRAIEIAEAKAAYLYDRIDIDELERRVAAALEPSADSD